MINPNRSHGPLTGTVQSIDPSFMAKFVIECDGNTYHGYDLPKGIKVGDKVTFHVQFSYTVVKDSVRRKRKPKAKIQIISQHTDSFGTLYVKFIGHDGQLKEVYFDEGDHWMMQNLTKERA